MRFLCRNAIRAAALASFSATALLLPVLGSAPRAAAAGGPLLYADFEQTKDGRPVSNRGGLVELTSYEENATRKCTFKGLAGATPPAPDVVKLKPEDTNHLAAYEYEILIPNQYAGVAIEINGRADENGKRMADDISAYKFCTFQLYVTGVPGMRIEAISHGFGIELVGGYPQMTFQLQPGLNTYRIKLDKLKQPSWAQQINRNDVYKNLTSISLTAYCENCVATKGLVVVDNVKFEN
jgi:hypothetical protein